jgi:predicted DNA-binding ribbon-helix-helix protein
VTNFVVIADISKTGMGFMKKSLVIKRSIVVGGHKTSVSLEDDFWDALRQIAHEHRVTLSDLVGSIDSGREHGNLSSTVRLFVLKHYRRRVEAEETEHPCARPASGETLPGKIPD